MDQFSLLGFSQYLSQALCSSIMRSGKGKRETAIQLHISASQKNTYAIKTVSLLRMLNKAAAHFSWPPSLIYCVMFPFPHIPQIFSVVAQKKDMKNNQSAPSVLPLDGSTHTPLHALKAKSFCEHNLDLFNWGRLEILAEMLVFIYFSKFLWQNVNILLLHVYPITQKNLSFSVISSDTSSLPSSLTQSSLFCLLVVPVLNNSLITLPCNQ